MDESKQVLSWLKRPAKLKKALSTLDLDELVELRSHFDEEIVEKQQELERQEQERQRKEQAIEDVLDKVRELVDSGTIKFDEIESAIKETKAESNKRPPRPPKYEYTDDNGKYKTWTGQGRTPSSIQRGLDEGLELSSYLIKK